MAYARAAARYAKSFLQLAFQKDVLEESVKDMQMINDTCLASKDLILLLQSPIVKTHKKLSILEAIFKSNVSEFTYSFIKLVIKSVDGVDDVILDKVKAMVKATYSKEVEIVEVKDKSLIGGFVLTIGDNQIDASISRRLAELRKEFSVNSYVKEI